MRKLLIASSILLIVSGCVSAPKLAEPLGTPPVPRDIIESVTAQIELKREHSLDDNVVQSPAYTIKPGSSVVINVPAAIFEEDARQSKVNNGSDEFRTKEFFNYAEQEIERELIRHGFRVLSRSKFEAKLRDLRDESDCNNKSWWKCKSSNIDPEVLAIIEQLEKKFADGKISATEYADQTQEFKARFQTSSSGKSREEGQKELTDISEVIRSAQSGDIQSDFILQINNFDTNKSIREEVNLMTNADIRSFVSTHPDISSQFAEKQYISCNIIGSELNAKLIDVKTGAIVWIGKHEVNQLSSGVAGLDVEIAQRTYVSNVNEVKQFVNFQNQYDQRVSRFGKTVATPKWKYMNALVGPVVTKGRCSQTRAVVDRNTRTILARTVAKELIKTIVVD